MTTADRLYTLLPSIYRIRDEQQGGPLRALVEVIAAEFAGLQQNLDQLYDDQFIETCQPWVVPYIGDLIGYRPLRGSGPGSRSPRAEVGNTIAYRRRKGTAAMLEQLARDVTGWPARTVEFFQQLATTQYMKHARPQAAATADLRSRRALLQRGGPFNELAHTAVMRRPETASGRYNIPNVGIFVWRLRPFALTNVPLTADAGDATHRRFRFNPLGADQPLFRSPRTETEIVHLADPINVPEPLAVALLAADIRAAHGDPSSISDYSGDASLVLSRPGPDPAHPLQPVPLAQIRVCDMRDTAGGWAHESTLDPSSIAIDPRLGRVLLGANVDGPLVGSYHYGFSLAIGGGEYGRTPAGDDPPVERTARGGESLQPHLDAIASGGRLLIEDSHSYLETPVIKVAGVTEPGKAGLEVVVAARDGARPLIAAAGPIALEIGARGRLILDGLVISGGALQLAAAADDEPRSVVLRHCTLVPGLTLNSDGSATSPGAASLVAMHPFASITLQQCVTGPLRVQRDATVQLVDCIVDAGAADAIAIEGHAPDTPGPQLSVHDTTLVGKVRVAVMALASNTLFVARLAGGDTWSAPIRAERRQEGCVRFCFVPPEAQVPRRFHCVPDSAHPAAAPFFTSTRYGDPGYMQLRPSTDAAICRGADDEGEIGVMHALFQPQKEANLRLRFDEYLRFGLRAGIFYAT